MKRKKQATVIANQPIKEVAEALTKKADQEILEKKYAPVKLVLTLVGVGAFLAASAVAPNFPLALKPFLRGTDELEAWKRFNIPYLKRTLRRLEKQKLIEISESGNYQIVKVTDRGQMRILKYALDELVIEKPKSWDGKWRLVSYDIPKKKENLRKTFREYLTAWGFYPFHESVFLHAYPCEKEIEFLREFLGLGEYVRILKVNGIENDKPFKDFFGVGD